MTQQQKIPEGWKEVFVNNICSLITNGFVGKATNHYTENTDGITYIQGYNIKEGGIFPKGIKKVTPEFHLKNKKSILKQGDLLTVQTGEVGVTIVVPKDYEGANCHALIISRPIVEIIIPKYLNYYYNSQIGKNKLKKIETGSTMKHLNVSDIKKLKILIPKISVQLYAIKILEAWDKYLEKLDQKIKLKKNIKKGLMQNLLTGKIRLKGFSDQWKNVLLKDISSFSKGQELSKSSLNENGKNECILYGELFTKYHEYSGSIISRTDENLGTPTQYGDILIPSSDVTPLGLGTATAIMKENVLIGGDINIIRPNKMTIDPLFLGYLLNQQKKKLLRLVTGTTIRHLYLSDIKKIVVSMPSLEEQNAIVKILTPLDKDIVLLKKQKEIIKNQKKYLLNNLITGQIRLPEFV